MKNQLTVKLTAFAGITFLVFSLRADPLETGFLNPPDSAKPQTWWHWMNGNITKEGITADLEAMKEIGLGGATIVNADCGIPHGPVNFMSPEWRDDFKFAIAEANRLGFELTVENCAGWSSSGGPWNTPENAMQQVVTSELLLAGATNFTGSLPQPPTKLDFYRDIAVLAYLVAEADSLSMKTFSPIASASSDSASAAKVLDEDENTFITLPLPKPAKPQFVQLEFAKPFGARTVKIIGGPGMPECNGVVQVSDDPAFKTGVNTIFNSDFRNELGLGAGKDLNYIETYQGKLIDAKGVKGRFVRLYSNGNTASKLNHYIEVEVWGTKAK